MSEVSRRQAGPGVAHSGGGSSGVGGGGGGGGGSDDASRFVRQAIARLNSERIGADREFLQDLHEFAITGMTQLQDEGADSGQFQSRWDQVIDIMIRYADENNLRQLNGRAFDGFRSRLCPGFWPFC
jgi:hypothetical protein